MSTRAILSLIVFCGICAGRAVGQDTDDPVRAKLNRAVTAYDAEMEKSREAVGKYFDKREEPLRKEGNKKQLDQLKIEREAFNATGEIPKAAPLALSQRVASVRATLERAYSAAIREYTMAKKDDDATAVERELERFRSGNPLAPPRPTDAVRFESKYFKIFRETITWHEAQKRCAALGGRLAIISSENENDFVNRLVSAAKLEGAWLGATDEKQEGKWVWQNGTVMTYNNWAKSAATGKQPNNGGIAANEHYLIVLVRYQGAWCDQPDQPKENNIGFVCQWD